MQLKKIYTSFVILAFSMSILTFQSCGVYSFTGASISPDVKTVQISDFPNYAQLVNPALSQTFTQGLQDLFLNQTNLSLTNTDGDLQFEGEITEYRITPSATTAESTAAQNRLTIAVKVRFYNNKDEEQNFDKTFSHYEDFDANTSLSGAVEDDLVNLILERIFENIFNESVANW
ncbi:MAG: LptE family protein [Flavobacteriales bacterium]|nr:LptE family protein [Flavobacteriales bacterium]